MERIKEKLLDKAIHKYGFEHCFVIILANILW